MTSQYAGKFGGRPVRGGDTPSDGHMAAWDDTNKYWKPNFRHLTATATWDPALLAAGAVASTTITVTGAVAGDVAIASHDQLGANNVLISAHVQAADTVRVVLRNETGANLDIASGTLRVMVIRAS